MISVELVPSSVAVTPAPIKFSLFLCGKTDPSSYISKSLPAISIVLVEPVPLAVTPAPVKLSVVATVVSGVPSSCTVTPPPPPPRATSTTLPVAVTARP